ncbi:hypothetical protein DL769_010481 [Monosporascus sp. CRB-8-3]|nr:hypothetical protein DL769_010481 [Monosporascus sp. CRB-8-3]
MARPRVVQPLLLISPTIVAVSGAVGSLARVGYIRQEPEWPPEIAGSVHDASWPDFVSETTRSSSYESPTFDFVFLPDVEEDLSIGARATGASLGGGVGRLQGKYGITSDSIRRVRMALWNVRGYPEPANTYFQRGVRGAGQNFGIVIETTFETYPASDDGMHYNVDMTFGDESLETVIDTVNSLTPDMNPALAIISLCTADAESLEVIIALGLVYAGPEADGRRYAQLFAPLSLTFNGSSIPWVDLPSQSAGGGVAANSQTSLRHNMYSLAFRDLPTSTYRELYDSFSEMIVAYPGLNRSIVLIETFGQEGVNALPNDYFAFPHRAEVADDFAHEWRDILAQPENSGHDRIVRVRRMAPRAFELVEKKL